MQKSSDDINLRTQLRMDRARRSVCSWHPMPDGKLACGTGGAAVPPSALLCAAYARAGTPYRSGLSSHFHLCPSLGYALHKVAFTWHCSANATIIVMLNLECFFIYCPADDSTHCFTMTCHRKRQVRSVDFFDSWPPQAKKCDLLKKTKTEFLNLKSIRCNMVNSILSLSHSVGKVPASLGGFLVNI